MLSVRSLILLIFILPCLVAHQSPAPTLDVMMTPKTVMVTGANGFIASHIVKQLLEKGHTVHACVRDASDKGRVGHLQCLPHAQNLLKLYSTGDLGDSSLRGKRFDEPMNGCDAVFHAATPLSVNVGDECDGETHIFNAAMGSTRELLDCIERNSDTVKCLVLTSSMSAVAPRPEPAVKDESHWSDADAQRQRGNWYGCTKTSQERLVQDWVETQKSNGSLSTEFKYAAICPTMVLGPILNTSSEVAGTMGKLRNWLKGSMSKAPNDSMSFIHVEDCARMHVNAMELPTASGRYLSLVESIHWNDIVKILKELFPTMPDVTPYEGKDKVTPTQFNLEKMWSLNVQVKSIKDILKESVLYLQSVGALD